MSLINVSYQDAVIYDSVPAASDILGVIMPYHWGPAGKINIFTKEEFDAAYPEVKPSGVSVTDSAYLTYYQVKSYFKNGGSRVAVYRPTMTYFGLTTSLATGMFLAYKYPGKPAVSGVPSLTTSSEGNNITVNFLIDDVVVESFTGQVTDVTASAAGESTYLPTILSNRSQYMTIVATAPTSSTSPCEPTASTATLSTYFGQGPTLEATQFLVYDSTLAGFNTACFYCTGTTSGTDKFLFKIVGTEKIKVLGAYRAIDCNAGVAGAHARVATQYHINQLASGNSFGAYVTDELTSSISWSDVQTNAAAGKISVFMSANGPQIFGVRNAYTSSNPGSYFARANVSRVTAALLRDIIPAAMDAVHTDAAANAATRLIFSEKLNRIVNNFIATQDLQADSKAICDGSNNSDSQTLGGQVLNIILSCHFIGLVEKVNIIVRATDSSVSVS